MMPSAATVVGAGPNGLAAAITLAQAGVPSVTLREAKPFVGGAASSSELTLPGFIHDRGSAIHPLGAGSPFFKSLPLAAHGLEWIHPPVALAHPLDDGEAVACCRSLEETLSSLGPDGRRYHRLMAPLVEHWDALMTEFLKPVLHVPRHPIVLAGFGALALLPARTLARTLFRGEPARALFAGMAAHSFLPLTAPGSAAFGLILGGSAHAVGWPMPRGGSQAISEALAGYFRRLGGTLQLSRPLEHYDDLPAGSSALLDLTAWNAARIPGLRLRESVRQRLANVRHGPGTFKVDYALSEPIPWLAEACRRAGTVHVGGTLDEISASERAVGRGEIANRPFVLLAQQSLFDSTRAPAGKHTVWAYCHVPLGCTVDMTSRIESQIERFAPGFRDCILARHVTAPADFAGQNENLRDGDITGGASDLRTLLVRPRLSSDPYRLTRDLFLCSSSTPPGGGVHGMCGHLAALSALR